MASASLTSVLAGRGPTLVVGGDPGARLTLARRLPGRVVVVGEDPDWLQSAEGVVDLVLSLPAGEALAAEVVVAAVVDRYGALGSVMHLPPVLAADSSRRQWTRSFDLGVVALRAVDDAAAPHLDTGCVVYGTLLEATAEEAAVNAARRGWAEARWRESKTEVRFVGPDGLVLAATGQQGRMGLREGLRGARARARALRRRVARSASFGTQETC